MFGLNLLSASGHSRPRLLVMLLRELPNAIALIGPAIGLTLGLVILTALWPAVLCVDLAFVALRTDHRSLRDVLTQTRVIEAEYILVLGTEKK